MTAQEVSPTSSQRKRLVVGFGIVAVLLVGGLAVVLTQRGGTSEEPSPSVAVATTSAVDVAASKAKQTAALQAAFDTQQQFVRTNNAFDKLEAECRKLDDAANLDCYLESTRLAEQKALLQKAGEIAGQLPTLLEDAKAGDAEGCQSAIAQFVDQGATQSATVERVRRVLRREGGVSEAVNLANRKYRAQFADGEIAPFFVNRFGVLIACAPAANWAVPNIDSEIRLDTARAYFTARYALQVEEATESLCFDLVDGSFNYGSTDETTVKTCFARTTNPQELRKHGRAMSAAFGRLAETNSWVDITAKCRGIIKSNIETISKASTLRADFENAYATNADNSVANAIDARLDDIDTAMVTGREDRFMACLTPKGNRPT
jgi:hypothetical protein